MRKEYYPNIKDYNTFKQKLLLYGNKFEKFTFLNSNDFSKKNNKYTYYEYDFLAGLGSINEIECKNNTSFKSLKDFNLSLNDWLFGFLSYDLKNELENLDSKNIDELNFPDLHFFQPEIVFLSKNCKISVLYFADYKSETEIKNIISEINSIQLTPDNEKRTPIVLKQRFDKENYIKTVEKIKEHIQLGDIYEINFCQEFYSNTNINPTETYLSLNKISPTPFSCFYKLNDKYLLSASPERYLKKKQTKVLSQPIKGTIRRSKNNEEDVILKETLYYDTKERAENVMIVDLVRNDLSRTATKSSIEVEELFGIYSFEQVHQMISTIVSSVDKNIDITEILKTTFPMGSMTGAPKIRAMKLIEHYEKTKRGLYSGAVGFITPNKDFDFNVVIRSILYNESKKYVSFTVGGAITSLSLPEQEYEECMIKAEAMLKVLN